MPLTLTSCERVSHIPRSVFADLARRLRNGDVKLVDMTDAEEYDGALECERIDVEAAIAALKAMS